MLHPSPSLLRLRASRLALSNPPSLSLVARTRTFSSSAPASDAAHSHDQHQQQHGGQEEYPQEGFSTPIWRNTLLALIAGVALYRLSQSTSASPTLSERGSEDAVARVEHESAEGAVDNRPFLTRYIEYHTTPVEEYKRRNERHLDLARIAAEEKLLFQEAERPPIHRLRFPATFEQASPHAIPVGSQIDLSDLKVKRANE